MEPSYVLVEEGDEMVVVRTLQDKRNLKWAKKHGIVGMTLYAQGLRGWKLRRAHRRSKKSHEGFMELLR